LFRERLRRVSEEADKVAIQNAVSRGELLNRSELMQGMAAVAEAMVSTIENSGLSRKDQDEIRRNLASIPVIITDVASRQDKRRGPSPNGASPQARANGETPQRGRGRPKKRANTETAT
jgi:hypothetical protein